MVVSDFRSTPTPIFGVPHSDFRSGVTLIREISQKNSQNERRSGLDRCRGGPMRRQFRREGADGAGSAEVVLDRGVVSEVHGPGGRCLAMVIPPGLGLS